MFFKTYRLFFLLLLACNCFLGASFVGSPAASKTKDYIMLKESRQFLRSGYASLKAQAPQDAVIAFSRALDTGKLNLDQTAKMLIYRAEAFMLLKQPAKAISDLNSALWLKDVLPQTYRKKASRARDAAYNALGITNSFSDNSTGTSHLKETEIASQTSTWKVKIIDKAEDRVADGDHIYPPQPGSIKVKKLTKSSSKVASTSWRQNTQTSFNLNSVAGKSEKIPSTKKTYVVQIASLRSKSKALLLARRIARDYAILLQDRMPEVELQTIGNMGDFYHVRIKHWPSKEAPKKLCKVILESGLDCLFKG